MAIGHTASVSNTVATDNVIGFGQNNGAVFESYGNNRVRGNDTSDTAGIIATVGEIWSCFRRRHVQNRLPLGIHEGEER